MAKAALSLPATKGFEFGSGFAGISTLGSDLLFLFCDPKSYAEKDMSLFITSNFLSMKYQLGSFMTGSEHNDEFYMDGHGRVRTKTNRSGGIQVKFFNFQKAGMDKYGMVLFINFKCIAISCTISTFRVGYQMEKSST